MPRLLLAFALTLTLTACGGDDSPEEEGGLFSTLEQANTLRKTAGSMQERMEEIAEDAERGPAETIDFRRLRELLPESAAGMERTGQEGSKNGAAGFTVSQAEGTYTGPEPEGGGGSPSATLTVSDLGGAGMAIMMAAAWTMAEVDQETDTSFERTSDIEGHPGYESFNTESRRGDVQLLVADRFLVKTQGSDLDYETLRALATSVDLGQLADWKDEGRPPAAE